MALYDHLSPSMTPCNHQWPSTTINHRQSSMTINDHLSPSLTVCDHQWPPMTINDHQWPSMTINDHQWLSMTINDHQWNSMTVSDHQWPYSIYAYIVVLMCSYRAQLGQLFVWHVDIGWVVCESLNHWFGESMADWAQSGTSYTVTMCGGRRVRVIRVKYVYIK